MQVVRFVAGQNPLQQLPERTGDRARSGISDRAVIDACDRGHLYTRTAEERFIGHVQFRPVDLPFLHLQIQLFPGQLYQGLPDDTLQQVGRDWRGISTPSRTIMKFAAVASET